LDLEEPRCRGRLGCWRAVLESKGNVVGDEELLDDRFEKIGLSRRPRFGRFRGSRRLGQLDRIARFFLLQL
jgi:hypothetical protein